MVLFCTKEVIYILKESQKLAKYFKNNFIEPIHTIIIIILYNNIILNLVKFSIIKKNLINNILVKNYLNKQNPIISIKILKIFSNLLTNNFFCSIDFFIYLINIEKKLFSFIYNKLIVKKLFKFNILKKILYKNIKLNFFLINRNKKLNEIINVLNKNFLNNPLLVGYRGVGKKSILNLLFNKLYLKKKKYNELFYVNIENFFSLNSKKKLFTLLNEIKHNNIILIFENIDSILKLKKNNSLIFNLFINLLYYNKLQIISIIDFTNYNFFINYHTFFKNIFESIYIKEPKKQKLFNIIKINFYKIEIFYNIFISNNNYKTILSLTNYVTLNTYLPKKLINILYIILQNIILFNKNVLSKYKIKYLNKYIIKYFIYNKINNNLVNAINKKNNLKNLEINLQNFVIGQNIIVKKVTNYIKKSNIGLKTKNKPLGSWIFCGPSGTGKTELTKYLSYFIYGHKTKIIRFDMSEFMEKHSTSRLIGSPPGYVGYGEGGELTKLVSQNPYSFVLFDEIEKAHSDITNIMLQVLDEGHLTDSTGKKIKFNNTYIIYTSNLGCPKTSDMFTSFKKGTSFSKKEYFKLKKSIETTIKKFFKPEFINRLTDILIFKPLSINNLIYILNKFLNQLIYQLKSLNKNLLINISNNVKILIAKLSYNPLYGARPLKRNIENFIEKPITNILLNIKINQLFVLNFYFKKSSNSIKYVLKKI